MTQTTTTLRTALAELIEQAAREDDGNYFSGAGVGIFADKIRVTLASGEVFTVGSEYVQNAKRPSGWCQCEGDQLAAGNATYFSNRHGHGWNCTVCHLLLQEG